MGLFFSQLQTPRIGNTYILKSQYTNYKDAVKYYILSNVVTIVPPESNSSGDARNYSGQKVYFKSIDFPKSGPPQYMRFGQNDTAVMTLEDFWKYFYPSPLIKNNHNYQEIMTSFFLDGVQGIKYWNISKYI